MDVGTCVCETVCNSVRENLCPNNLVCVCVCVTTHLTLFVVLTMMQNGNRFLEDESWPERQLENGRAAGSVSVSQLHSNVHTDLKTNGLTITNKNETSR